MILISTKFVSVECLLNSSLHIPMQKSWNDHMIFVWLCSVDLSYLHCHMLFLFNYEDLSYLIYCAQPKSVEGEYHLSKQYMTFSLCTNKSVNVYITVWLVCFAVREWETFSWLCNNTVATKLVNKMLYCSQGVDILFLSFALFKNLPISWEFG